jgi:predicted ester cyclase
MISDRKEENIEEINKEVAQEFFTNVYDKRNVDAIDQFVTSELSIFNNITSRSKLKEDIKKLLDLFPDLKHDIKHIIAEGESIAVLNKWKSSKGNLMVAFFLRIEKRQITKWDEIHFYSKEIQPLFEKEFPEIIQGYSSQMK